MNNECNTDVCFCWTPDGSVLRQCINRNAHIKKVREQLVQKKLDKRLRNINNKISKA